MSYIITLYLCYIIGHYINVTYYYIIFMLHNRALYKCHILLHYIYVR